MAQQLGNYIHYYSRNYKYYGINKIQDGNYGSNNVSAAYYNKIIDRAKQKIVSSSQKYNNLNDLSTFLTKLIYSNEKPVDNEIFEELKTRITEEFEKKYSSFGINWNNLTIYHKQNKTIQNTSRINHTTVQKYLNDLNLILSSDDGSLTNKKRAKLLEIQNKLNSLYLESLAAGKKSINVKGNKDFVNALNYALGTGSLPTYAAIGEIFELFLGATSQYIDQQASKEADILSDFTKNVVGSNTGTIRKISGNFYGADQKDIFDTIGKDWKLIPGTETEYQLTKTPNDKTDVIFRWNGNKLNVSAKNLAMKHASQKIGLVNKTPLFYLIQNIQNTEFVNHWLNAVSVNKERIKEEKIADTYTFRKEAHQAMKVEILLLALTGQHLGITSAADTFIINWRSKKTVYVLSMSEILGLAINDLDKVVFSNYPTTLQQEWAGEETPNQSDASKRIGKLILSLYQNKISVSLRQSLFN